MTTEELKAALTEAYVTLHHMGVFDYAGDVSVRGDKDTYLVRSARVSVSGPAARSQIDTRPEDILTIDPDGEIVDGGGQAPIEAVIHTAIYAARPAVRAIIHAHPRMVNALTIAGLDLLPVYIRGVELIGAGLPSHADPDPITTLAEAERLLASMDGADACLLPAHGVVVCGQTIAQCCMGVINLEQSAEMQYLATVVGTPRRLPEASIARRLQINTTPDFYEALWSYYVAAAGSPNTEESSDGRQRRVRL